MKATINASIQLLLAMSACAPNGFMTWGMRKVLGEDRASGGGRRAKEVKVNIANHMMRAGRARAQLPAVAKGAIVIYSYEQLAERVARLAGGLANRFRLTPGERIALVMRNCPHYLEALYACWHAGLVAVPVNAKLHPNEFSYILDNCGARMCFATSNAIESVSAAANTELDRVIDVVSDEYAQLVASEPIDPVPRNPEDPAWLFYTSGTTGRPKGAVLSHRNLLAMCFCYFADVDPGAPWRCTLHAAPMSHGSGLYGLAHVIQASCHIMPEGDSFEPGEVYELIRQWSGLSFFAAPTMLKRLLDYPQDSDTSNLKTIIYGGGPMYLEDCLAGLDRFGPKLSQLYGQGESPMTITALNANVHAERDHPRWRERLASVGTPQSVVEVRVADSDDEPLSIGEVGEILVRGDSVMSGYWRSPEASAATLRSGWLHTGDIGVFDSDNFLTLKDRSKDLIISGGANIYPREIEEVLVRHPDVAEASVIGRRDRDWGEVVVAYVVLTTGAKADQAILDTFCQQHIARFKRPKDYRFVDALPKNDYGKVLKTMLRKTEQRDAP